MNATLLKPLANAAPAMRRILSLTVLLATATAQAMATACPMGITGASDHHRVVPRASTHAAAHGDRDVGVSSHADGAAHPPDAGSSARRASAHAPHTPFETGADCALTMSCAPLIPAPNASFDTLGWTADVTPPFVSNPFLSTDMNAATPPPRPLVRAV